jgi:hypothetical protein
MLKHSHGLECNIQIFSQKLISYELWCIPTVFVTCLLVWHILSLSGHEPLPQNVLCHGEERPEQEHHHCVSPIIVKKHFTFQHVIYSGNCFFQFK